MQMEAGLKKMIWQQDNFEIRTIEKQAAKSVW